MAFSGRSASWPQALCSLFAFSWWALCCQQWKLPSWNKSQEKWWCHFTWQKKTDSVTYSLHLQVSIMPLLHYSVVTMIGEGTVAWKGLVWAWASLQVSRGEQRAEGCRTREVPDESSSSRITHHVTGSEQLYTHKPRGLVCLKSKAKRVWRASPLSGGAQQGFVFLPCPLY